jgi:hypothetical protein
MKNVIISMIAKISKDGCVEAKQLTARVEAQSLLLSALVLTLGKTAASARSLKTLRKPSTRRWMSPIRRLNPTPKCCSVNLPDLLSVTQLLDDAESEIDFETLNDLLSNTDDNLGAEMSTERPVPVNYKTEASICWYFPASHNSSL